MMDHGERHQGTKLRFSHNRLILLGFLVVIGFFLLTEHRAHLYGILPWLLLLACPFLHFFHGGHGGHGGHRHGGGNGSSPGEDSPGQN